MPLTPKQDVYLDDLLFELRVLIVAEHGGDACTAAQRLVDDFRAAHPTDVPLGIGRSRPGRPVT